MAGYMYHKNDLEEVFPEGISALLVDRTSSTPEKDSVLIGRFQSCNDTDVLVQVLIASFVVQLFTLQPTLNPSDYIKVINQRSLDTLQVLALL